MIQAELKGKLPNLENWEDILTDLPPITPKIAVRDFLARELTVLEPRWQAVTGGPPKR
jgi:hypothetical protein